MDEQITISKDTKLQPAQDYELLRSEGLKFIENLGSDSWTDYNAHDPGITILEALCYAITELSYRTNFDINDFAHNADGTLVSGQTFYTAKNILTINPLTINDYRKLLVDIVGIQNAWLIAEDTKADDQKNKHPVNEVEIFADCKKDQLSYEPNANPLYLSGLYRVLLDLEFDDKYGDLNNGDIIFNNPASTNFNQGEFVLLANFKSWKDADFSFAEKARTATNIDSTSISQFEKLFRTTVTLTDTTVMAFDISIPKKPSSKEVLLSDIQEMLDTSSLAGKEEVARIFKDYFEKISRSTEIVKTATRVLQATRNLCEDFIEVTTVDVEEIAFCFDVDVHPAADIEKVQAEMFFAIENYLNPPIEFYSLKELRDKQVPVDEIFEGPILQHGFIDTNQLEATNLRTVIHSSDIINLLMDIEGVQAIRNFLMTKYGEDGKPVPGFTSQKWCMHITPLHKPVLSKASSKILLFKNQLPFLAQYDEVKDSVALLHALQARQKLNGLFQDIEIRSGSKRDTESYWPVQHDLPQTYGVGQYGLPAEASAQRIAKQRQLKAYLMFFEQLLADFLSQLSNAFKLYSVDDIKQTYYAQYLHEIKDIEPVYNTAAPFTDLENVLSAKDATVNSKNGWQYLYEKKHIFEDRRGRFLDHLLARFAESFNDYALLMYRINYEAKTEEKISISDLSSAKIETLKHYPEISSERGKAFNYFPQKADFTIDTDQLWDTTKVSGLEKRIAFLAGIQDSSRRFLYCIRNEEIICSEKKVNENGEDVLKCFHTFSFTSRNGERLHSSEYDSKEDARQAMHDAIELGADINNYLFDSSLSTLQVIGHSSEILLESDSTFPDKDSAMDVAAKFVKEFSNDCPDEIGLHLIEHILLRPRNNSFDLMQVCLHDCDCLCELDPYTFRASVVLPAQAGHFANMDFRKYFEDKIREEAPAHVMLKICWLNNDLMRRFEVCYKRWIETLADFSFENSEVNTDNFKTANNDMIEMLALLHSEYPKATLHDCVESKEGSNTVVLGKTILGTFKS